MAGYVHNSSFQDFENGWTGVYSLKENSLLSTFLAHTVSANKAHRLFLLTLETLFSL